MKDEAKVRRKLKQVIYRHLKKRLETTLRKRPENCLYNRHPCRHPGMTPITDLPRVCIHVEQAGAICDKSHPNSADYQGCPYFTPAKSEAQVRKEFVGLAKSPRDRVAEHMPDAAALMWVLEQEGGVAEGVAESAVNGDEGSGDVGSEESSEDDEEPDPVTSHRITAPTFEMTPESEGLLAIEMPISKIIEDQYLTPTRWWMFWRTRAYKSRWNPIQWPWYWQNRQKGPVEALEPPMCNPAVDE